MAGMILDDVALCLGRFLCGLIWFSVCGWERIGSGEIHYELSTGLNLNLFFTYFNWPLTIHINVLAPLKFRVTNLCNYGFCSSLSFLISDGSFFFILIRDMTRYKKKPEPGIKKLKWTKLFKYSRRGSISKILILQAGKWYSAKLQPPF